MTLGRGLLYRGTSPIRNRHPLGPYSRAMPRALGGPRGGGFSWARYSCTRTLQTAVERHGRRSLNLPPFTQNSWGKVRFIQRETLLGYLAHKKQPPPVGACSGPMPGDLW